MDNITHSLIGVILADGIVHHPRTQKAAQENPPLRNAIITTAILASNLPDLDIVMRFFREDAAFSYLLDHRGWTHTAILLPLQAFFAAAMVGWIFRKRVDWVRARGWLLGVAGLALFFHVFADFWNEYGIHPFAPFDGGRWYYGDFIFIVEPWLWIAALPLLLRGPTRVARILGGAGYALLLFLMVRFGALPGLWVGGFFAAAGLYAATLVRQRADRQWLFAVLGVVAVLGGFHSASYMARARVQKVMASQRTSEVILQLATSPMPSNPVCWRFVIASRDRESEEYLARVGAVSLVPERFPVAECLILNGEGGLMPSQEVRLFDSPDVRWQKEFRAPIAEMRALWRDNCGFQSVLRFARIPFWTETAEGLWVGDLRYDRGKGRRSFANHLVSDRMGKDAAGKCALWSWESPLAPLFKADYDRTAAGGPIKE